MLVIWIITSGCHNIPQTPGSDVKPLDESSDARTVETRMPGEFTTVFKKLEGEWISTRFDKEMRSRRSVFGSLDANAGKRIMWIDVRPDSAGYRFVYSFDLYDSAELLFDSLYSTKKKNLYGFTRSKYRYEDTIGIVNDGTLFYWCNRSDGEAVVDSFIRIPSTFENYLRGSLVAGFYRDGEGKSVAFDTNGIAVWDKDTLQYEVGHYFFWGLPMDDYIQLTDKQNGQDSTIRYGFRWRENEMFLYRIIELDEEPWSKWERNPVYILMRR